MSNETLPLDYYKKDKEMRDVIQSFHEMLDSRYKEVSSKLRSLYEAQVAASSTDVPEQHMIDEDHDPNCKDSTAMVHVAEVHQDDHPSYMVNPVFAIPPEDISFGDQHKTALNQIKDSIEQLFGANFAQGSSDKNACLTNEKKVLSSSRGNLVDVGAAAPHLCTVAWNKAPKRYQECVAIVRTVDSDNQPLLKGGAGIKGTFSWSRYDKQFCKVIDNEDGTYQILYSACSVRFHLLFITVNGCEVAGSPFIVDVDDDDSWE